MPHPKVRVVLCGLGLMGRNHLRILRECHDECEVVALVETVAARREQVREETGIPAFERLDHAIERTRPDAVVLATSTDSHAALALVAIQANLPTLIEKPVAGTMAEAHAILEAARRSKTPVMVGHVERFNPAAVALRHLVENGDLGAILSISTRRVGGTPEDATRAGDVLVDLAIHDLDLVAWLTGVDPVVHAALGIGRPLSSAKALLRAGQTSIDLHVNWVTPIKIRSIEVTGTNAFVSVNLIGQEVIVTRTNPALIEASTSGDFYFQDYLRSFAEPDTNRIGIQRREPLRRELLAFLAAVAKKEPTMPVPLEGAIRVLALADAIRSAVERLSDDSG